ncbi:MAG: dTDP-4-dehydrorhamnose 3,5-epimerase [Calditrichia bacterium]
MEIIQRALNGVLVLKPRVFEDHRGFFFESYNKKTMESIGITENFVQDNHSRSRRNTLRGLHYQINPGQGKLVRVIVGEIFDVAVDIRFGSPTFGHWFGQTLSAENKLQMYLPVGFAHGFCVVSEFAEVEYKCTEYYSPGDERGIIWNDPDIGIDWPVKEPILSEKDQKNIRFREIERDFVY